MIDKKTIEKIASLARIELGAKEEEKFKHDLSSILDYVDKLGEVSTDNVKPFYQADGESANITRSDGGKVNFIVSKGSEKRLINQAPDRDKDFVRVKSVFNK